MSISVVGRYQQFENTGDVRCVFIDTPPHPPARSHSAVPVVLTHPHFFEV